MRSWSFAKGHGTMNDFVIITDRHAMLNPDVADVRYLCDRRIGVGGDGMLRAIKASRLPEWDGDPDLWFMDYRNADGSIAEMCGNGIRVFARYLLEEGLAWGNSVQIATRSGVREVAVIGADSFRVEMGPVTIDPEPVTLRLGDTEYTALAVDVGNPHAVVHVDDPRLLNLDQPLQWSPADRFPDGVNVEFVHSDAARHLTMRVLERGSGETKSCGTGTVAAAAVAAHLAGEFERGDAAVSYLVDVPGGRVAVEFTGGTAYLTGPAVIVARGDVNLPHRDRVEG